MLLLLLKKMMMKKHYLVITLLKQMVVDFSCTCLVVVAFLYYAPRNLPPVYEWSKCRIILTFNIPPSFTTLSVVLLSILNEFSSNALPASTVQRNGEGKGQRKEVLHCLKRKIKVVMNVIVKVSSIFFLCVCFTYFSAFFVFLFFAHERFSRSKL